MPSPQASVRLSRSSGPAGAAAGFAASSGRRRDGLGRRRRRWCGGGARSSPGPAWAASGLLAPPHGAEGRPPRHLRRWARRIGRLGSRIGRRRRGGLAACSPCRRRTRPREGGRAGLRALQDADALRQRLHSRIEVGSHRAHGGDLEDHLRVGRLAHVDQRVAQDLHAAHHPRQPHRLGDGRGTARATVPTPCTARAPARRGRPGAGRRSARSPAAAGPSPRPGARSARRAPG